VGGCRASVGYGVFLLLTNQHAEYVLDCSLWDVPDLVLAYVKMDGKQDVREFDTISCQLQALPQGGEFGSKGNHLSDVGQRFAAAVASIVYIASVTGPSAWFRIIMHSKAAQAGRKQ